MSRKITVLNFSGRMSGNCAEISRFISDHHNRTDVRIYNVRDIQPCGRCEYECLKPALKCPDLSANNNEIMDASCSSDLIYFIIPNYCGFPNAAYFAFNEHSVGYFNMDRNLMSHYMSIKKRFIVVSNTESDSFKSALQQQTTEDPEILYLKSSKYGKRSIAGDILTSEEARADLKAFLDAY